MLFVYVFNTRTPFQVKLLTKVKVMKYMYDSEHLGTVGRGYPIPD